MQRWRTHLKAECTTTKPESKACLSRAILSLHPTYRSSSWRRVPTAAYRHLTTNIVTKSTWTTSLTTPKRASYNDKMAGRREQQTKRQAHLPRKTTFSRKSLSRTKPRTCVAVSWELWVQTPSLNNKQPFNRRDKTCLRGIPPWRVNANNTLSTSTIWFPWGVTRTHPHLKGKQRISLNQLLVSTGIPVKRPSATRLEP